VLVFDPYVAPEIIQEDGGERVNLDTLFAESDYISLHTPLSPETKHIIDEAALKKMKQTAIVVNTARGELIDEDALIRALKEGWILAAGLDVFEKEPLSQNHPLLRMPNAVLTGHVAWYSKDSVRELQTRAAHEVLRVLSGKIPDRWVNKW
jgi:D-3-phosphoglycerate dehydrogenase